jgi:hypothetical protein
MGIRAWLGLNGGAPKKEEVEDARDEFQRAIGAAKAAHAERVRKQDDEDTTTRVLKVAAAALIAISKGRGE